MIEFRLKQSGWDGRKPLFSSEAYREVYVVTKGYPRKVTNLCHNCMIEMLRTSKSCVDIETVQHVVATELPRSGREAARISY
jgi:type II secretory pathway predicted ATPase ExeA